MDGLRPGQATFAMPASGWLTSALGTVQGGFLTMLAYSALASAIQTTADLETGHVPIDLKVNFLHPVFAETDASELIAHGMVAHRGRNLPVADAEILNTASRWRWRWAPRCCCRGSPRPASSRTSSLSSRPRNYEHAK